VIQVSAKIGVAPDLLRRDCRFGSVAKAMGATCSCTQDPGENGYNELAVSQKQVDAQVLEVTLSESSTCTTAPSEGGRSQSRKVLEHDEELSDSDEDSVLGHSTSTRSFPANNGSSEAAQKDLVSLQGLLEDGDFIGAKAKLQDELSKIREEAHDNHLQEQATVLNSPFVKHLEDELRLFRKVGQKCCGKHSSDSFCIHSDVFATQAIHGCFDPHNPRVFHYHLRMVFPSNLAHVFSVAFEDELAPLWNSSLSRPPEVLENKRGFRTIISSQVSALLGLLKLDFLDATQRFVDVEGGMVVEYIRTIAEGEESYRSPLRGFKRTENDVKSVWAACGADKTLLLQAGTVKLPIPVTRWLATSVGSLVGRHIITSMVKTAQRVSLPGNPFEKVLEDDIHGIYARLRKCVESSASRERASSASLQKSDLERFFGARSSSRMALQNRLDAST